MKQMMKLLACVLALMMTASCALGVEKAAQLVKMDAREHYPAYVCDSETGKWSVHAYQADALMDRFWSFGIKNSSFTVVFHLAAEGCPQTGGIGRWARRPEPHGWDFSLPWKCLLAILFYRYFSRCLRQSKGKAHENQLFSWAFLTLFSVGGTSSPSPGEGEQKAPGPRQSCPRSEADQRGCR